MTTPDQPRPGWTPVLRRKPARIVAGQAEGGYTDAFEIICPECGDRPDLDYREVSPVLRQIRGPYPLAAGVTAYERHHARHRKRRGQAATAAIMALDSPCDLTAVMPGDTCPVQWAGRRAVMTLPEQIDVSNAGQIAEGLLSLINRGAAELIADMTATVSCDYAGADAVTRAYRRAVVSGTQLRLVVTAPIVRRVFTVNGLDRLIPIYPWLEAAVAGTDSREAQAGPSIRAIAPAGPEAPGLSRAADQAGGVEELLDRVVSSIFGVGMILQAAAGLPRDAAGMRIADALNHLDDVIREVRQHVLDGHAPRAPSGSGRRLPPTRQERLARAKDHAASLKERAAQTAQALQLAAADTAALLEQRADLAGQPTRIDYPTEIKRWRALADQAEWMTKHWEQRQ